MKSEWRLGAFSALFIFVAFSSALIAIIAKANIDFLFLWQNAYLRQILWFSFYQAFLSTLISIIVAIPITLALRRRNFIGKEYFMRALNVIMAIPALIAILGILSVYGNGGFINSLSASPFFSIYGLTGILLAHSFFNIPLATRLFYHQLENISAEEEKLALQLGIKAWSKFILLEFPEIRKNVLNVASLIFVLCFTSFAIILLLGGGPKYATLEVAIYEAFYFNLDFDLGAGFALWQIIFCLLVMLVFNQFNKNINAGFTSINLKKNQFIDSNKLKTLDFLIIFSAFLFLFSPLIGLVVQALNPQGLEIFTQKTFYKALFTSLFIAVSAGFLAIFFALNLINANVYFRLKNKNILAGFFDATTNIVLIVPSLVLATGYFLIFYKFENLNIISYAIVIFINSLMALPFVNKILQPSILQLEKSYEHLYLQLNIRGLSKLYFFQYQAIKPTFREALGFAMVMSLGDISAIALFGNQISSLSWYLFNLMGNYRNSSSWSLALFLLLLCFVIFSLVKLGLNKNARNKKLEI